MISSRRSRAIAEVNLDNALDAVTAVTPVRERSQPLGADVLRLWVYLASATSFLWLTGTVATGGAFPFMLALAIITFAAAAIADAATFHVPNTLTYPAIVFGIVAGSIVGSGAVPPTLVAAVGSAGPSQHLLGLAVWFGVCLPAWLMRLIGGGDLKLLCALGALIGLQASFNVVVSALPVAMLYALLNLASGGGLNLQSASIARSLISFVGGPPGHAVDPALARVKVPLAVPLCIGMIVTLRFGTTWLDWALSS